MTAPSSRPVFRVSLFAETAEHKEDTEEHGRSGRRLKNESC